MAQNSGYFFFNTKKGPGWTEKEPGLRGVDRITASFSKFCFYSNYHARYAARVRASHAPPPT
jgi:hypothetical protein